MISWSGIICFGPSVYVSCTDRARVKLSLFSSSLFSFGSDRFSVLHSSISLCTSNCIHILLGSHWVPCAWSRIPGSRREVRVEDKTMWEGTRWLDESLGCTGDGDGSTGPPLPSLLDGMGDACEKEANDSSSIKDGGARTRNRGFPGVKKSISSSPGSCTRKGVMAMAPFPCWFEVGNWSNALCIPFCVCGSHVPVLLVFDTAGLWWLETLTLLFGPLPWIGLRPCLPDAIPLSILWSILIAALLFVSKISLLLSPPPPRWCACGCA